MRSSYLISRLLCIETWGVVSIRQCAEICCLDKSDRIAKSLIASRTNRIVMHRNVPVAPKRHCVITCYLDKSDRMGLETCFAFHCAAVSSSDIFGTAVSIMLYWSIAPKLSRRIFFLCAETAVPKISDDDTAAQ